MTQVQSNVNATGASTTTQRWQLRWASVATRWSDPLGICGADRRSGRAELVVDLELQSNLVRLESWIELPDARRRRVLEPCSACDAVRYDGGLCHIDATLPANGRLVVTLDGDAGRLLYAQATLAADAGFSAGAVDPPTLHRLTGRGELV